MRKLLSSSWLSFLLIGLAAFGLTGCPESGGGGLKCLETSCHGHGVCDDSGDEIACTCDEAYDGDSCEVCAPGYQDLDGDGECAADCGTAGLTCSEHGACDDSSGAAVCQCDAGYAGAECADCAEGYQDNDSDGTCLADCDTAGYTCDGLGQCDDSTGVAMCVCDEGYQDNDADGVCSADCAAAALECGEHGECDDLSGTAVCACDEGWGGDDCAACGDGYQDNDEDGTCEPSCSSDVVDCGAYGVCDDSSGQAECQCITGHAGDDCSECVEGYQDNDGDGACAVSCMFFEGDCGTYGMCDDSTGQAMCVCLEGHQGDDCSECADGYQDNDGDGMCNPSCASGIVDCGANGQCQDDTGELVCVCTGPYTGPTCSDCAAGYQDNDDDGVCAPDCSNVDLTCGANQECNDSSGEAVCTCFEGYTGVDCTDCADGYQDNDDNSECLPSCELLAWTCSDHGSCDDQDGTAGCECDAGYGGGSCEQCATDYQDNDGDGECTVACSSDQVTCVGYAHCEDSDGSATCVCNTGYTGLNCDSCDTDYQDSDNDGTCLPSCEGLGWTCAPNGVCTYVDGAASCACDDGFIHDGAGLCIDSGDGSTCAAPMLLDLSQTSVSGNTMGLGSDYQGSCQDNTGEDLVYFFTVIEPIHVSFEASGFDTVIYLRDDCDNFSAEIACSDDDGEGLSGMIDVDLDAGTYYLFVDGYSTNSGPFELAIDVSCGPGTIYNPATGLCVPDPCLADPCTAPNQGVCSPVLPADFTCSCDPGYIPDPNDPSTCILDPNPHGESCADVMILDTQPAEGSVTGTTTDALDDADSSSCGGDGPDRVYTFTLTDNTRVEFLSTGYDTVLHLRSVCGDVGSEEACADEGGPSFGDSLLITNLAPGTYYLWVDSWSDGGDYTLTYSFRTDPCADDEAVCPGVPVCESSDDYSSYECVCPDGYLPYDGQCVDNPCDPNTCTEENMNRCVPDLANGLAVCECNLGYIDDGSGGCMVDPNGNKWAFIVFLNADNNLEQAGYDDIAEMGQAGSNVYVHIVTLFDTYTQDNGDARKLYVTPGGYTEIENLGEVDMGDWQTLRDFGIWAVENYPAQHYAFVMWNHGAGWDRKGPMPEPTFKSFSNDDNGSYAGISISNGDYARAMAGITSVLGRKIDLVGFDACLMGMWEVAAASAPYADYLVASSETEPFEGWAYHLFMPDLVDMGTMTPAELGTAIVDAYYDAPESNPTQAVTDLSTIPALNAAVSDLADELMANPGLFGQVDSARSNAQGFYDWSYRDLKDFALNVAAISGAPSSLVNAANAVVAQVELSVVHSMTRPGYEGSYGLSVYLPSQSSSYNSAYSDTGAVWSADSTWDEFLQAFLN